MGTADMCCIIFIIKEQTFFVKGKMKNIAREYITAHASSAGAGL
jgi:hypothetical protein